MYKELHSDVANFCGATAVIVLLIGNKLVCANVGDARALLCRNGQAIDLSIDHKAVSLQLLEKCYLIVIIVEVRRARAHKKVRRIHSLRPSVRQTCCDASVR